MRERGFHRIVGSVIGTGFMVLVGTGVLALFTLRVVIRPQP